METTFKDKTGASELHPTEWTVAYPKWLKEVTIDYLNNLIQRYYYGNFKKQTPKKSSGSPSRTMTSAFDDGKEYVILFQIGI